MAMDNTILKVVFCLILTDFSSTTSNFCKNIIYHTTRSNWKGAMETCESQSSKLMKPTMENIQNLSSCNQNYGNVWVDKFQYLSPWIELYGCYTWDDSALDGLKPTESRYIPAICERKCKNSDYFGIKNEKCYCISETFKNIYLIFTSSINCSASCDLEPNLPCGGPNTINLYRRVNSESLNTWNLKTSDPPVLCAVLSCETTTISLYERACEDYLQVLCDNGNYVESSKNWTEQLNHCRNNNYPYRYTGDSTIFCNKTTITWSGVFRSIINGSSKCFSDEIVQTASFKLNNINSSYVIESTACSEKLKYICIQADNDTETPKQSQKPTISTEQFYTLISTTFLTSETTVNIFTSANGSNMITSNIRSKNSSDVETGIIVGAFVLFVVVICLIAFVVIARKRGVRLSELLKSKDEVKGKSKMNLNDIAITKSGNLQNKEKDIYINTETVNQSNAFEKPSDRDNNQGYELIERFRNYNDMTGNSARHDYESTAVLKDNDHLYTDLAEKQYETLENKIGNDGGNFYTQIRVELNTDNDYVNETGMLKH